jgi:hypothetical protein
MTRELSTTSQPGQLSGGLARLTKRETDAVVARTEIARTVDQGRALLTASALNNVGNLAALGEQLVRIAPNAAGHYDLLINAYAIGAANQIARFQ